MEGKVQTHTYKDQSEGVYRQLKEEHMKSHEGPQDAVDRYILLKLVDLMVASHDLETHRRQNKLEIGK